jgi:iron complex transport system substrate-binding protein
MPRTMRSGIAMSEHAIERPVTRRGLLAIGLGGGVSLLLGCGSATRSEADWTFVDDRMHTVRLRQRPTRIVAYTTAAAALYDWGVTPVGVIGADPKQDPALAGFPWNKVQIVGSVYGEIDIQALRSLRAELIVSRWYPPPDDAAVFGFTDLKQQERIGSLVPIVGIDGHAIATRQIDRFGDLARALGVNTGSGMIGRARAAFLSAAGNLSRIARRRSNLRIIAVSGEQSTMYVAKVVKNGDLGFYAQRGVPLVSARTSDPYWDRFPWKKAGKYPADAILYDARATLLPLANAKSIQAFADLPAVRANQVGPWHADPPPSYQAYTRTMNDLAKTIEGWRRVI